MTELYWLALMRDAALTGQPVFEACQKVLTWYGKWETLVHNL